VTPAEYLIAILSELTANPLIASFDVVEQWLESDRGYARVRVWLDNDDFLELAEYFSSTSDSCTPERYRHQWMDATDGRHTTGTEEAVGQRGTLSWVAWVSASHPSFRRTSRPLGMHRHPGPATSVGD